jgi:hypothetical protein
MKRVPDFVGQVGQQKVKRQTPFQCRVRVGGSKDMILLKFTSETFKTDPVLSDKPGPYATVKRRNQIAIQVAPDLWRSAETRRDSDYDFLKGLGRAGAVVEFLFDVTEGPGPQSFGEFANARINEPMMISVWPNPERRYPVRVRGERLVFCMSAHRNDPYRIADTAHADDLLHYKKLSNSHLLK